LVEIIAGERSSPGSVTNPEELICRIEAVAAVHSPSRPFAEQRLTRFSTHSQIDVQL
jgi:hypothetical protein